MSKIKKKVPVKSDATKILMERIKVEVPVDVDVSISEDLFARALRSSKLYWTMIKPRLDLGSILETLIKNPEKFYAWFYTTQDLTLDKIVKKLRDMAK